MPTFFLKEETEINSSVAPFETRDCLDLDGYTEAEVYINVPAITGGTLQLQPLHSTRNRNGDYFGLTSAYTFTATGKTRTYQTQFGRYLGTKVSFTDKLGGNTCRYEILVVPKKK